MAELPARPHISTELPCRSRNHTATSPSALADRTCPPPDAYAHCKPAAPRRARSQDVPFASSKSVAPAQPGRPAGGQHEIGAEALIEVLLDVLEGTGQAGKHAGLRGSRGFRPIASFCPDATSLAATRPQHQSRTSLAAYLNAILECPLLPPLSCVPHSSS